MTSFIHLQRATRVAGLLICFSLAATVGWAQTADQESCSKRPCTVTDAVDSASPVLKAANEDPEAIRPAAETGFLNTTYAVSLNGDAPIALHQPKHLRLLYALSTSQGYDSDIAGPFSNIGSYTSIYEGYAGALWKFNKSAFLLQQDSAVTYFGSSQLQGASFHQTAFLANTELNENLGVLFEAYSSIGNNTLTQLIPPTRIVVNGIPVISPAASTAGLDLGFVWGTDLVGTLNWKPDSRDIFSFRAENANHQFYGLDLHDNLETFKLTYQRALSENTTLGAYGITRHETGTLLCDSYGFGLSAATKPINRLYLQAEAGPEFDSTGCFRHQGFEMHFAATYQTSRTSHVYALVDRQLSSGFVPSSTWQDDAGAGFAEQLSRRLWWSVGAGYSRGFVIPSLTAYHGIYAQTEFRQRLSDSFSLEALYRRLDQSITSLGSHRNIVIFTLRWSPRRHDPGRSALYQSSQDFRSGHEE